MSLKFIVSLFSSFFILGSVLAVFGFTTVLRDKQPWPSDIMSNIAIIGLSLFFIYLVREKEEDFDTNE